MTKILHTLYSYLPDLSGSSIRSAGLLGGQRREFDVVAVTSPFQPGCEPSVDVEDVEGLKVYRTHRRDFPVVDEKGTSLRNRLRKVTLFPRFTMQIARIARQERVTVIHAHSTFYCAMSSYVAARALRLKVVYEFRSVWEERARSLSRAYRWQAAVSHALETASLRMVDRVVTINEGLKAEIVSRGIAPAKVDVVPNAVDDALLTIGAQLDPPSRVTRFGYIGNFSLIEGLDLLVRAFGDAFPGGEAVELLFHGAGPFDADLRKLVDAAGDARIRVAGRFTRDEVKDVYQTVDCVVLPRRRLRICEVVTPLKPLEAMAFKRLVLISDVGGLVEVVGAADNAVRFRADDVGDLAARMRELVGGKIEVRSIAQRGRDFVVSQRAWSAVARAYLDVYAKC